MSAQIIIFCSTYQTSIKGPEDGESWRPPPRQHPGWRQRVQWKSEKRLEMQSGPQKTWSALKGIIPIGSGMQFHTIRILSGILENENTASLPSSGVSTKNSKRASDLNIGSSV